MKTPTFLIAVSAFAALTTTVQAKWLCLVKGNIAYSGSTSSYEEPTCLFGQGDSPGDCQTNSLNHQTLAGVRCYEAIHAHTNQVGGFWTEGGDINYQADGQHWYCNPGDCNDGNVGIGTICSCDAGGGAPSRKAKRNVVELD